MSGPVVKYPSHQLQERDFQPPAIADDHYIIVVTLDGWRYAADPIDIITVWPMKCGGPAFWFGEMPACPHFRQILLSPEDVAETAAAKLEDLIRCMDFGGGMCARVGGSVCWGGATNVKQWQAEKRAEKLTPFPANAFRF